MRISWIKILITSLFITALFGCGYYYYMSGTSEPGSIYSYKKERDLAPILQLFKTDRYWLLANPQTDPTFLMTYKTPSAYDPYYFGKLTIKVLREDDTFIGFVAYYKKTFREGFLLFVAIKPEFRGKQYAEKLVRYAIKDLKQRGAAIVRLVTRSSNTRAQALYNRLDFYETHREDGFVYFAKRLNTQS